MKSKRQRKIFQALGIGMIHEHTHDRDKGRNNFDDFRRARRINASQALFGEVQSDGVGPKQDSVARIVRVGDAANFDACHRSPRSIASGSGDVIKDSPIRNASAPASSSSRISLRPRMPLSTTKSRSSGIFSESRKDVFKFT